MKSLNALSIHAPLWLTLPGARTAAPRELAKLHLSRSLGKALIQRDVPAGTMVLTAPLPTTVAKDGCPLVTMKGIT